MVTRDEELKWAYLLDPCFELTNSAGKPLTDGYIEVYIAGTRNKYYCASDFSGTLHPFQIPLDSLGSNIVLANPDNAYDVYVYNRYGNLVMSRYNVTPADGGAVISNTERINELEELVVSAVTGLQGQIDDINETLENKKDKQEPYSVTLTPTQTVSAIIQNENGEMEVIYQEIDLPEEVPNVDIVSPASTLNITTHIDEETNTKTFSIDLSDLGHLEYGQFMATQDVITGANMYRIKGNLNTTLDGKIQLHKGNSYHITVRGYYTCSDISNITDTLNYIEYSTFTPMPVNVDNTVEGPQYFEISYDIFKLSADTNYYIAFAANAGKVSNLTVEIHSLSNISILAPESYYQEGWGIDIVSSVISVDPTIFNDYSTHTEVYEATVTAIQAATSVVPEVAQSDWAEDDPEAQSYIKNKPDLDVYATHNEVYESSVSSIQLVTGLIPDVSDFATHEDVHESIVTAIEYVTGIIPDAQVQSDWNETDTSDPSYIQNKPDLDIYVTHDELVEVVSAVTGIGDYGQFYATAVSGAAVMARTKGTIDVTNDGKIKLTKGSSYHVTVRGRYNQTTPNNVYSNISYIEYITFNNININVDKSITESQYFEISYDLYKLNSDTDYYIFFSGLEGTVNDLFIEIHAIGSVGAGVSGGAGAEYDAGWGIQILNNVISVDPSIFNDYVTENELVTAIQSVVTAIPSEQVQSDWTEDDSADPAYIKNKPEEIPLIAGDNIGIFDTGVSIVISASGTDLSDYVREEELIVAVTAVTAAIPAAQVQSDWTEDNTTDPSYIQNKPVEYNLIAGQNIGITVAGTDVTIAASGSDLSNYATHTEVSEAIVTAIDFVTGMIPEAQVQSDWTEDDTADPAYIQNKPTEIGMYAGDGITIEVTGVSAIISAQGGGGTTYEAGQYISIDSNDVISVTGLAPVSSIPDSEEVEFEELDITQFALASAIPVVTGFATKSELSDVESTIPTVQLNGDDQVTAINNHEIAGTGGATYTAGDYIDITNDTISVTGLDNSNIFWAIYGTTTYNEITDAITAGKKIFLKKDNTILPLYGKSGTQYRFTTGIAPDLANSIPGYYYHYVTSNNGWYGGTYYVQSNWNETDNRSPRYINNKPSIPTIQLNGDDQVTAIDGHTLAGGGGGGTTYTAGDYISIANDVISVTGVAPATAIPETEEVEFEELDLSNYALASAIPAAQVNSDWNANSGVAEILNKPTEIQLIAGTNVQIEVSGVSAVISAQGGGGGSSYTAGDFIDITNNVISVDDTSNVVAGDGINITVSGANTVISLGVTAGITDIQLVNSLPASPTSTVLYLIPET